MDSGGRPAVSNSGGVRRPAPNGVSNSGGVRRPAPNGVPLRIFLAVVVVFLGSVPQSTSAGEPDRRTAIDFFEKSVRPVLIESCQKCHGPQKQSSELRLDSREAILKGGLSGPAVVPGKPDESLLVQAVAHSHDELKMPPKGKLSATAVTALRQWVQMGAPWGDSSASATATDSGHGHWAFAPLRPIAAPTVKNGAWVRSPVDAFVLARLEKEGIAPSAPADRRTLIRRATLDLLGVPPTAAEIDAFAADPAADAFARVVERLLASPFYGERWGRHWLDVARYADTKGYVFTAERKYPFAYTYRDYVIRAFNADMPFNRFVLQQIAADQLDLGGDPGPLAAMGFLTVGRRFLNDQNEIIDDRIDLIGRGLLGLTIGCARCHDHKYDPIPSADYYSLYGVFASSVEPAEKDLPPIRLAGAGDADAKAKKEPKNEATKGAVAKKGEKRHAVGPVLPRAMVMRDAPKPVDPHIFVRGNPGRPGKAVPRQFLEVLAGPERKPFAQGSGRLELARAIVDPTNPLSARVLVNRVWQWHFGQALVTTPSDFGLRSDPPSHPELLDDLARSFLDSGWSIKALHRRIMLSSTYQQSSDLRPDCLERDPRNRLLWRFNRQRLDFEAMRDSVLAVAGTLDPTAGGPSVALLEPPFPPRRTVYGFIDRQNLDGVYRTFDFAVPDATNPKRFVTTVPQQALFLMNSPFVQDQARKLAAAVERESSPQENQVRQLYRRVLGRSPEPPELALGAAFLNRKEPAADALSPLAQLAQVLILTNEFLFVD
jgi:hypothetical protein